MSMRTSHDMRPRLRGVVHVTQKVRGDLPGLRNQSTFRVIREAIRAGNEKPGFRVVAFSVLSNHLHYMVEAGSTGALSRGMQGLAIRVAKALNRHLRRRGKVFLERFFAKGVRGMGSLRRALVYVLQNARKHRVRLPRGRPDPYSSAPWFRFWRERHEVPADPSPVAEVQDQWLSAVLGLGLSLEDVPASASG